LKTKHSVLYIAAIGMTSHVQSGENATICIKKTPKIKVIDHQNDVDHDL